MRYNIIGLLAAVLVSGNAAADTTWVLEAQGLFREQAGKPRLAIRLSDWVSAGEPYACAPGMATGPRGEAVVTSNVLPVLWRVDPQTLAVSMHRLELDADTDKDVGFSAIVYSERLGAYFAVSELTGSLWRIDPLLRRAQKIALSEPVRGACALKLCMQGRTVNLAPDQRSAYVQAAGCAAGAFTVTGGIR